MEENKVNSGKKHFIYAIIFIFCIVIFAWIITSWVRKDANSYSVEDKLKDELLKNPLKTNNLSQNSAQSQASASTASQTSQNKAPVQNLQETESANSSISQEESPDADTKTEDINKFESTDLKASFEYPKDVTVSESDNFITVSKGDASWKMRFYDNKNKKEFNEWYLDHYEIKNSANCTFTDAIIKVGSHESKLVKSSSESNRCDGNGNFAISSNKSRIIKIEIGKETAENVNKILTSFKFLE